MTQAELSATDKYLAGFRDSSGSMIANLETQVNSYHATENISLPTTLNESEYHNSYVCSPYTALVPYCLQELGKLDNRLLRFLLSRVIQLLDKFLKKHRINQILHINNWMLSTNLYPDAMQDVDLKKMTADAITSHPNHVVILRSLNAYLNSELMKGFKTAGYILAPSRQVYLYNKSLKDYTQSHNYKIDKKLLEKTDYQYVPQSDISKQDYPRIVALYNMLYIDKYSEHNPQFTEKYIATIIDHPNFYLEGFRNRNGVLDAVGGRFTLGSTITLPIVGYDVSLPKRSGLYRLVLITTLLYAERNKLTFNASSGASQFKLLRGAVPYIEYSAVYIKHLPKSRQRVWKGLAFVLERLFVPLMKKYQL